MFTKMKYSMKSRISYALALVIAISLSGCGKNDTLTLSGTIESNQIDVNSEVAGKIISLNKEEGSVVKKGDVLATVDSSMQGLVVKQQESAIKLKQDKLDALKSIPKKGQNQQTDINIKTAEADLEQSRIALEQAKLNLSKYEVKSAIDGTYIQKNTNIGDIINAGTSIATLSDLTDLWTRVYIPEKYLSSVQLNREISLKTISKPDQTIKGKIIFISNQAEFTPKNTETTEAKENTVFKIKIKIVDNPGGLELKPGMNVDAIVPIGG